MFFYSSDNGNGSKENRNWNFGSSKKKVVQEFSEAIIHGIKKRSSTPRAIRFIIHFHFFPKKWCHNFCSKLLFLVCPMCFLAFLREPKFLRMRLVFRWFAMKNDALLSYDKRKMFSTSFVL